MFTIQVDNLEIMMIDHLIQSSEEEDTTEKRNKRRNKIAALESRIQKKKDELMGEHHIELKIVKMRKLLQVFDSIISDSKKVQMLKSLKCTSNNGKSKIFVDRVTDWFKDDQYSLEQLPESM